MLALVARTPVLVSWSSGKDSAWALHALSQQCERFDVRGIFTTVNERFERVSIHSTPIWVLREQSTRLGVPVYEIPLPDPCSNAQYEAAMERFLARLRALPHGQGATHLAFGDLFLEDIRRYREDRLSGTGFVPIFPVWGRDTSRLAEEMIQSGLRAIVTSVNPAALQADFAGRWFDRDFLADLPASADPLGENGEFHTCVVDGPMFSSPISAQPSRVIQNGVAADREKQKNTESQSVHPTYVYADVIPMP